MIAAVGAGDAESEEEMVTFGFDFGDVATRVVALRDTVETMRDRGYPVWVGGHDPAVREVAAAHADGWNKWGGGLRTFRAQAEGLRIAAAHDPFTITWGGLVVLGATDAAADDKAARLAPSPGTIIGRARARRRRAPRVRRRRRGVDHRRPRRLRRPCERVDARRARRAAARLLSVERDGGYSPPRRVNAISSESSK